MANTSFTQQLQREPSGILEYFPMLSSPAIYPDKYTLSNTLIIARTISGVALSFIAMAALYWTCPPIALLVAKYEKLAILGSCLLSYVPGLIEFLRARSAADSLAAEEYISKPMPSDHAMRRLSSSHGAFQSLLDKKADLTKGDLFGESLAFRLTSYSTSKMCRMLIDSGIDLLAVHSNEKSLFMNIVRSSDLDTLKYILESKKVDPEKISKEDQVAIWKHVNKNDDRIKLLCQYGFDINAQDAEGTTPLMHWAQTEGSLSLCTAAVNAGANLSLKNAQDKKASELVPEHNLLQPLLLQAEKEFENKPISLPQEKGLMAWLPWKSFACKDTLSFHPNFTALIDRVYIVGIAAMLLFTSGLILETGILVGFGATVILSGIEFWRSIKEANRQAVVEYLTSPIPSKQSTYTICHNIAAARLLIEHSPPSLNKLDENGQNLLGNYTVDPEVFKLLVDHGADIFAGRQQDGFWKAISQTNPQLLAHILDKKLLKVEEMSAELQIEMWTSIGSKQGASFLREYGFHPDVKDAYGNTALMRLAKAGNSSGSKIEALLAVGADKSLQNNDKKTAKDLAPDQCWIAGLL